MDKVNKDAKILVVNIYTHENTGEAIRQLQICKSMLEHIPEARITVVISGHFTRVSFENNFHDTLKILEAALPSSSSPLCFKPFKIPALIKAYMNTEIVVSVGGHIGQISSLFPFFLANIMKKGAIVYGASTTYPIKNWLHCFLVGWILNRAKLITVREEASKKHLKLLGVTKPPIYVTAPPAFLWVKASKQEVDKVLQEEDLWRLKPLIGINISRWPGEDKHTYGKYILSMTKLIDYLTGEMRVTVVLLPFCFLKGRDDRVENTRVKQMAKYKDRVKIIERILDIPVSKGILGSLDLFVGTRYHANVLALSESIPTLALSYHHKMNSTMEAMGMSEWVYNCPELDELQLIGKVINIWHQRKDIKMKLEKAAEVMKKKALYNIELINQLIALDNE